MIRNRLGTSLVCGIVALGLIAEPALARGGRGGGGGARGGGGGFHGGGARPSMGRPGGGARPSARPAPRPSARPSTPRPSFGASAARPGSRPSASRPSVSRPSAARPSTGGLGRPSTGNRPNIAGRPGYPGSGARPGTRPPITERPSLGGGGSLAHLRPGQTRPTPLPAPARPGGGGLGPGGGNRPGSGGLRPGGGERPGAGGLRPGGGERPGQGPRPERPIVGPSRPSTRPNRPIIRGGNVNIGNRVNVNRPGWGYNPPGWGYNRPGWGGPGYNPPGWGYKPPGWGGGWGNHWYNNCVGWHHHGWYHGCWPGHWGNNWYVPLAYGATMWGLGALSSGWGYNTGYVYSNPYYVAAPAAVYDYSQPIAVATYQEPTDDAAAPQEPPPETPEQQAAYTSFDAARASFKAGRYDVALKQCQVAIQTQSGDAVLHEFAALCYFALGQYTQASAILNNLMAVAPGMDWTSLSGLYPSISVYQQQLTALQNYCAKHPTDAAAHFVLAYHKLISGDSEAAIKALEVVVKAQPKDQVAAQMLAALTASPPDEQNAAAEPPADQPAPAEAPAGPSTDLVGNWSAQRDKNTFDLTISEDGTFIWRSTPQGGKPIELKGKYTVADGMLILDSGGDQGAMVARVEAKDANNFQFVPTDAPPNDEGLSFRRRK